MSENRFIPYEYAIVRYVHDTTTSEFLNVGVAIYAPALKYLRVEISPRYRRIKDTFYAADGLTYSRYAKKLMRSFDSLSKSKASENDLFTKDEPNLEPILRKYLRRESSFQYSMPASGVAANSREGLEKTFENLYFDYVEKYTKASDRESRTETEVWRDTYRPALEKSKALFSLSPTTIRTQYSRLEYDHSWKNGRYHLIEIASFDLTDATYVKNKADRFLGKNVQLNQSPDVSNLYMLLGEPKSKDAGVLKSYSEAKSIISNFDYQFDVKLIEEDEASDFASHINQLIKSDKSEG